MTLIFLLVAALLLGGIAGFLVGRFAARASEPPETDEKIRLRRQVQELSAELQKTTNERAGDLTIASQIPIIVRRLGERLSPGAIPGIAVRTTKKIFGTPTAGFFALRKEDSGFYLVCGVGFPNGWKGIRRFSCTEGILGTATQQQIGVAKEDYLAGMKSWPLPPGTLEEAGLLPDLVAPVVWGGRTYGALVLSGSAVPLGGKRPYASMMADMVASAFQNSIAVETADLEASTDPLTGLYNRAYLSHRFEAEVRRARNYMDPLSVLLLDIDHFKKVNDTYGHPAGDVILKKLAEIIRKVTRASDFVVRYGGIVPRRRAVHHRPAQGGRPGPLRRESRRTQPRGPRRPDRPRRQAVLKPTDRASGSISGRTVHLAIRGWNVHNFRTLSNVQSEEKEEFECG